MIDGHCKFFTKSKCLGKDGAEIEASSGDESSQYALDQNPQTVWRSSGSNDLTTETITVTFTDSITIDRIFLLGHNLKDFSIKYENSGSWTHFASVIGLDGSKTNITETTFADDTAYYEFTPVTTTSIQILATKTQSANEEKYISQIIVCEEYGTLVGWPRVKSVEINRNNRVKKTISGFYSIQKSIEVASFDMDFKDYPATDTYNVDMDLMLDLHDLEDPFLVWLCGGKRGSTYFKYTLRGFRLQDLYQVKISKALNLGYSYNIYTAQINAKVEFESTI